MHRQSLGSPSPVRRRRCSQTSPSQPLPAASTAAQVRPPHSCPHSPLLLRPLPLLPHSLSIRLESFHRIQPLAITPSRYRNRNAFRNSFLFLNYYFLFERVFRSVFFMLDLAEKIGGDIGQYMDVKRSDVLAIRSLQQIPKPRPHRKLADF
ncbi:hypothetical protein glysoja_014938 [Glycine soja]|nr:hypothetical protein glysoja_014938 [Glycine soja]